jgi:hypothetical protein
VANGSLFFWLRTLVVISVIAQMLFIDFETMMAGADPIIRHQAFLVGVISPAGAEVDQLTTLVLLELHGLGFSTVIIEDSQDTPSSLFELQPALDFEVTPKTWTACIVNKHNVTKEIYNGSQAYLHPGVQDTGCAGHHQRPAQQCRRLPAAQS